MPHIHSAKFLGLDIKKSDKYTLDETREDDQVMLEDGLAEVSFTDTNLQEDSKTNPEVKYGEIVLNTGRLMTRAKSGKYV